MRILKKRIRRKYLENVCDSRETFESNDGYVLENEDVSYEFNTFSDEENEKMYERFKEEY